MTENIKAAGEELRDQTLYNDCSEYLVCNNKPWLFKMVATHDVKDTGGSQFPDSV